MKFKGKLKIVNEYCKDKQYPCYYHILIDDKIHCIENNVFDELIHSLSNKETYHVYDIELDGNISYKKGYMPNPMYEVLVIRIESFKLL